MKKQTEFYFCDEDSTCIRMGKKEYKDLLLGSHKLTVSPTILGTRELLARIRIPRMLSDQYRRQKVLLVNNENGAYITVEIDNETDSKEDTVCLTQYIRDALSVEEGDTVYLCAYNSGSFRSVRTQRISHIRENDLVLSPRDEMGRPITILDSPCTLFEVYNTITKENIVVKRNHIYIDESLPDGTIRLNRKQRHWLGLELPLYLADVRWKKILQEASKEEKNVLFSVYDGQQRVLMQDITYDKKEQAKKIINKYTFEELRIIPVVESLLVPLRKKIGNKISDFFVGKSTISLTSCRPYEMDEGVDIVRITRSNMNLLGVDEMDKIILQYKHRTISCRVLSMDDEEQFLETNTPSSKELRVGIPVHIRKKLGITDLVSSVKIDRDTAFIFRKSINEQLIPVLLTICSTQLFSGLSGLLSAVLSILLIPLVVYVNLSSKRNMRG